MKKSWTLIATTLAFVVPTVAQTPAPKTAVSGHINKPAPRPFTDQLASSLKIRAGFKVDVFASKLGRPRMIAAAPGGAVYVTRWETNDVVMLRDTGTGKAGPPRVVASGLEQVHGIALDQKQVFLASPTTVWTADLSADGAFSAPRAIITNLPDGGQHRARNIAIGPDRMLYISVGSSCNDCAEANQEHATMQRAALDGSKRSTFARGLRHTVGFGWHPKTQLMWGMDNGADWKGDTVPPEELNQIKEGADYGWPVCGFAGLPRRSGRRCRAKAGSRACRAEAVADAARRRVLAVRLP